MYEILDDLGSFRLAHIEAICWTHRQQGWDVIDEATGQHHWVKNKTEARRLARKLVEPITFSINGVEVSAPIDPEAWPLKHFEHGRAYVTTRTLDGREFMLTIAADGYHAHPAVPVAA